MHCIITVKKLLSVINNDGFVNLHVQCIINFTMSLFSRLLAIAIAKEDVNDFIRFTLLSTTMEVYAHG